MAFIERNIDPSASGSSGLARGVYRTSTDTLAECEAAGYFNAAWGPMRSVASLLVLASDDSREYRVSAVNGVVTLTPALTSSVGFGYTFMSRAAAAASLLAATFATISVMSAPIPSANIIKLDYIRDPAGTALTTAGGVKWSPAGEVWAEHFGSVGDGDEAKATNNIGAFELAIAWTAQQFAASGGTVKFTGRHCIDRPLVISRNRIFLKGFGPGVGVSKSEIRGIHQYGPVIRWKGDMPGGEDFIVSSSASRRTATRVTKDNFVTLGLTRDEMNPGIWLEPDDSPSNPAMDKPLFTRVWSHNQPSDGWVCVTRCYSGAFNSCGASVPNGHGIVISSGEYTDRTNLYSVGVLSLNDWSTIGAKGHGICVGTPSDSYPVPALRVLVHSCDNYNNATDATVRFAPYDTYFKADDSYINNSGLSGSATIGAALIGGKRLTLSGNRVLGVTTAAPPIKVMAETVAGRPSDGILIERCYIAAGSFSDIVEVEAGSGRVEVVQSTLDGTFSALSAGAAVAERGNVRRWDGSLQIPLTLWGKSTSDDTTAGARMVADANGALLSISRNTTPLILNRLSSNGAATNRRRDGQEISSDIINADVAVSTSATTIFTLNTRAASLVIVAGSYVDGGTTRRFYDLVFFAWGLSPSVISTKDEDSPAVRTYGVLSNSQLRLTMASGTYQVRASGSTTTIPA